MSKMSLAFRYTIRYDYSSTETQVESKHVPNEYISMHIKNKRPAPRRMITQELSRSPYPCDYVILRWEGDIQEGYTHVFPERLPCNCLIKIEYAVPLKNFQRDSISIPYIMNALAVIGDLIPLELRANDRFLPLINWYTPRNPLKSEFSDSDEEASNIQYQVGFFRRDISAEIFSKTQELVSKVSYQNRMC